MGRSLKLSSAVQSHLRGQKNLLAFSAGVDSSALFFLLQDTNIEFDIALVNYGLRPEADDEEAYALSLAKEHSKKAFTTQAPHFTQNFEKSARDFRYAFFDELMEQHGYDNLLTAHQLNDQLEWFLMRLSKGAGLVEVLGLECFSTRQNYTLVRPLLEHSSEELLRFLDDNQFHYFIDKSNQSEIYERNRFRQRFTNELMKDYEEGIRRSFKYLKEDKSFLTQGYEELYHRHEFYLLSFEREAIKIRIIDKYLKKLGYLLSSEQRKRLKGEDSLVFGHTWAVEIQSSFIYIAPYKNGVLPKRFKEQCRVLRIPSKIRPYLYEKRINLTELLT